MADREIPIKFTGDSKDLVEAFEKADAASQKMGDTLEKTGTRGTQALEGIEKQAEGVATAHENAAPRIARANDVIIESNAEVTQSTDRVEKQFQGLEATFDKYFTAISGAFTQAFEAGEAQSKVGFETIAKYAENAAQNVTASFARAHVEKLISGAAMEPEELQAGNQALREYMRARQAIEEDAQAKLDIAETQHLEALAAKRVNLQIRYENEITQAVERADTQRVAADERWIQTSTNAIARLEAVTARSAGSRTQLGTEGAPQRLQRLLETEAQMARIIEEAGQRRLRQRAEISLNENRALARAAEQRVEQLRTIEGTGAAVIHAAEQQAIAARQVAYAQETALAQQHEAELAKVMREGAQAQANAQQNIGIERALVAAGSGGGGIGGIITGLFGGGGFGGFFGGLGGIGANIGKGILGGLFDVLKGAGSAGLGLLGGAISGGFNVLMAPVRGLGSLFGGLKENIDESTKSVTGFIEAGLGLYSVYQIADQVKQIFTSMRDAYIDFQAEQVKAQALTDARIEDVQAEGEAVIQIQMETGASARLVGESYRFAASHGLDMAHSLLAAEAANKLMMAGFGESPTIIRTVVGAWTAYGATEDRLLEFFDKFTKGAQLASIPTEEFAGTLNRAVAISSALHIPFETLVGDLAVIDRTGLNASRTTTDFIALLSNMLHPTEQQEKALKALGTSSAELRKELADPNVGLNKALVDLYNRAGGDLGKLEGIFGDRTRGLVGFISLLRDNGGAIDDIMGKMADSAGSVDKAWSLTLGRLDVQWARLKGTIQGFGEILGQGVGPAVAAWMNSLNEALSHGRFDRVGELLGDAFQSASKTVLGILDNLAKSMFGAGQTIVSTLAEGITSAIGTILNAAVTAVADFIASMLLGHSWPPAGPLSRGDRGTQAWMQAKAKAMLDNEHIVSDAAAHVAAAVDAQINQIGSTSAAGYSESFVKQKIADIDAALLPWKNAAEDVKNQYDDMLRPIDRQIDALRHIKDLENDRLQLQFRQQDLELDMLKLRAEGDPVKRAQLAGQIARQQEINERHSIDREIASLQSRMRGLGRQRMTPQERALARQEIADQTAMLNLRRQEHALTNPQLLGQYAQQKALLDVRKQSADLDHRSFELHRDMELQPLIEAHDKIVAKQKEELDQIGDHVRVLEQERKKWQEIERQIQAAKAAEGDSGKGGAFNFGDPEIYGKIQRNATKFVSDYVENIKTGFNNFMNGPEIKTLGQAVTGAILGGMLWGIPGAVAGATFFPRLFEELKKRGIQDSDIQAWATGTVESIRKALSDAAKPLSAANILGSVESVKASFTQWSKDLELALFREWQTVDIIPIARSEGQNNPRETQYYNVPEGTTQNLHLPAGLDESGNMLYSDVQRQVGTRHTGLGRTIIEAMFGQQDANLNYQTAYKLLNEKVFQPIMRVIDTWWRSFTGPSILDPGGDAMSQLGPSNAQKLGQAILNAINGALDWVDKQAGIASSLGGILGKSLTTAVDIVSKPGPEHDTLVKAFEVLGVDLGKAFATAFMDQIPILHDTNERMKAARQTGKQNQEQVATGSAVGVPAGTTALTSGPFLFTAIKNAFGFGEGEGVPKQLLDIGRAVVLGIAGGQTDDQSKQVFVDAGTAVSKFIVDGLKGVAALNIHSPSEVTREIGHDVVEGLNLGIEERASTTGAIVRTWVNTQVLDQARAILQGSGGREPGSSIGGSTGLTGILAEAVSDMSTYLSGPHSALDEASKGLGREIARNVQLGLTETPFKLTVSGTATSNAPKAAPTYTPPEPGSVGAPPPIGRPGTPAATGADFIVGPHGTDTEYRGMWLTPGERVQVTPVGASGGSGDGANEVHIHISSPLIQVENMSGDAADLDSMLDHVRQWLVEDVATARGQGVIRPSGYAPRGTR